MCLLIIKLHLKLIGLKPVLADGDDGGDGGGGGVTISQ